MKGRVCLNCSKEIPDDRRSNALYCTNKCGNRFRNKRHYNKNPEYYSLQRFIENSNVEKRILSRIKSRAKGYNIPFNLELSDIIIPDICPVLGIKIKSIVGGGTNQYGSASVDRIIPDLGYTKGNIRVISQRANLLKSNATIEELEKVLEDLRGLLCT